MAHWRPSPQTPAGGASPPDPPAARYVGLGGWLNQLIVSFVSLFQSSLGCRFASRSVVTLPLAVHVGICACQSDRTSLPRRPTRSPGQPETVPSSAFVAAPPGVHSGLTCQPIPAAFSKPPCASHSALSPYQSILLAQQLPPASAAPSTLPPPTQSHSHPQLTTLQHQPPHAPLPQPSTSRTSDPPLPTPTAPNQLPPINPPPPPPTATRLSPPPTLFSCTRHPPLPAPTASIYALSTKPFTPTPTTQHQPLDAPFPPAHSLLAPATDRSQRWPPRSAPIAPNHSLPSFATPPIDQSRSTKPIPPRPQLAVPAPSCGSPPLTIPSPPHPAPRHQPPQNQCSAHQSFVSPAARRPRAGHYRCSLSPLLPCPLAPGIHSGRSVEVSDLPFRSAPQLIRSLVRRPLLLRVRWSLFSPLVPNLA